MDITAVNLYDYINYVPDHPKPGINFADIAKKMLSSPAALWEIERQFLERLGNNRPDYVVGLDARGFILAGMLWKPLDAGIIMARKKSKLPGEVYSIDYELEYGTATLQIQKDVIKMGDKVLIVDDVLATGGTAKAAIDLVEMSGGIVTDFANIIEVPFLKGRDKINTPEAVTKRGHIVRVHSLLQI